MDSTELRAMAARVRVIAQKREAISVGSLDTIAAALSGAAAEIELLNALFSHLNLNEDKRETHRHLMRCLTVDLSEVKFNNKGDRLMDKTELGAMIDEKIDGEIKDKTQKMWQWLCQHSDGRFYLTTTFYPNESDVDKRIHDKAIKPALWTEIEVKIND